MSISYQSKDDRVLSVALKVQELVVRSSDSIVQVAALPSTNVTIDVGEIVVGALVDPLVPGVFDGPKPVVIHCDDSFGLSLIAASGVSVSGSQITVTLSNAMAANDALIVRYSVKE